VRESINADRKAEVWRRLETVTDPELDEPVTALEFVTRADVDADNCVHVEFACRPIGVRRISRS